MIEQFIRSLVEEPEAALVIPYGPWYIVQLKVLLNNIIPVYSVRIITVRDIYSEFTAEYVYIPGVPEAYGIIYQLPHRSGSTQIAVIIYLALDPCSFKRLRACRHSGCIPGEGDPGKGTQ